MTPREYWNHYVERQGGIGKLAESTGIPYSTLAGVTNGHRGIGRALADRLVKADPLVDPLTLVWVRAEREASSKAA